MKTIQPDSPAIQQYYRTLQDADAQGALHEGNVRAAFENLLRETARDMKGWSLVSELGERRERNRVEYDGVLRDGNRLPHGYWEAKDTQDDLDSEIRRKRDRGYRFDNIIFEDTRTAVLFQDGLEVVRRDLRQPEQVADLLNRFYGHEIEPFKQFEEAVAYFQGEIPHIAGGLKDKIETAHRDNRSFQTAFDAFMELCRAALNPNLSVAAADEMLIQHMLTERLIRKVFNVEEFTRRNVIAAEIEKVIDSLASQHFNRREFLGALDRFYTAIENAADKLATFTEKQDFINHVYERFFQGYSVKIADTHGIVYTPQPIVDFMCAAVEEVLLNEFGVKLGDEGVYVIDPCTGTGNFAVNLLRRAHERNPRQFERFYRQQLFANEVMLMPYYIASLNIEHEYYALTGHYEPFDGICFVDTLDMAEGPQMRMAFMTEKNTERVERQKAAPITVIIGNPPYNVGQLNENDNNKNRKYEVIDARVNETYASDSKATLNTKLYDPYVKFFRWAVDRLQGRDGIVCYVSNNSFVDQIAFDGMRKHLLEDFTAVYHLDLHGNVRQNPKLSGTTHNVFGIQVGVGITVAVRSTLTLNPSPSGRGTSERGFDSPLHEGEGPGVRVSRLFYHRVPEFWRKEDKLAYLADNVERAGRQNALNTIEWEELIPDSRHTWLIPEHADEFATFLPMGSKETKAAKGNAEAIFKTYSLGVSTNRDNVVYDFDKVALEKRIEQFCEDYNAEVDRYRRKGKGQNLDDFVSVEKVKWSDTLKRHLRSGHFADFDRERVRLSTYRPFTKQYLYYDDMLVDRPGSYNSIFPTSESEQENRVIVTSDIGYRAESFSVLIANSMLDLHLCASTDGHQCFPFYVYDADGTNRRENITDWALAQFRERYETLTLNPSPSGRGTSNAGAPSFSPLHEGEGAGGEGSEAVYRARASEAMEQIARELRQRQTPAEVILWEALRNRRLDGLKFRRQHAIENTAYVADFLCYDAWLVVELDGGVHEGQRADDAIRQENIEAQGYHVLRFKNEQIFDDLETVLATIASTAHALKAPLPQGEGLGVRVQREITKWDIFYYVYGLLHHPAYRQRYADNLKRELPRIPFAPDFWTFADAGRRLADLHLNYESVAPYELEWITTPPVSYRVEKMRLNKDKSALAVNPTLTLQGIPAEAYDYRLGNRSALEWVIDQYQVSTDRRSGIVSDPNGYSDDERYIVDLVERVVRVSVETVEIVRQLSALPFVETATA